MATILVRFDGGAVPIVTGDIPANSDNPITAPVPTAFVTNQTFIVAEGIYCFALDTAIAYAPLWQVVQAVDGEQTEISFHRKHK